MKRKLILAAVFAASTVFNTGFYADAEVYQYIDDKGREWFVNGINSIPSKYREQLNGKKGFFIEGKHVTSLPALTSADSPEVKLNHLGSPPSAAKVEVYVTDWCPYCRKLEQFLREKGIAYKRYNIELDEEASNKYAALGGRGVPVTKIGSKVIHGYNPDAVLRILNK